MASCSRRRHLHHRPRFQLPRRWSPRRRRYQNVTRPDLAASHLVHTYDLTRFSVVGCSAISFPSMIALQLVVIVSESSNWIVNACMCDSLAGLIPHVLSKSKLSDFES